MASLSNINGLFDVHSTGAILFSTSHGTSGQILRSNGNAAPTWVDASTVIGGPYLPLSGGTLTGATATASGISFTVGGTLTGTSATFAGNVGIGVAAHATASLNITNTDQHIRLNNGSELGIINLDADGKLDLWAHGTDETISFRTGTGSGIVTMSVVGSKVGIGTTSPGAKLEVVDSNNYAKMGDLQGDSTMSLRMADNFAFPVEVQAYGSELRFNTATTSGAIPSVKMNVLPSGNVGIGTISPSGPFHVKVGTSTPLIVASSSYCNNVGIRTTTPTASLQVKGNVSYCYNNYTNVATTWINVINFSGYPAGLYQISIIKKTDASTYITAIVKWSGTAGTVVSTIASNQLGIGFNGSTILQAISGIATGTLMSANLQCLVTNEDFCS